MRWWWIGLVLLCGEAAWAAPGACERAPALNPWPELAADPGAREVALWRCADAVALEALLEGRAQAAPVVGPSALPDPLEAREGLAIYQHAVARVSRGARLTPILFVRTPGRSAAQEARLAQDPAAREAAAALWGARGLAQWRKIQALLRRYAADKETLRAILLRDGYLFLEDAATARAAFRGLRLEDLFDEPQIFLRRGDGIWRLRRAASGYVYDEGPSAEARARLLLFDRVGVDAEALRGGSASWDLDRLRRAAGLRALAVTEAPTAALLRGEARLWEGARVAAAAFTSASGEPSLALVSDREGLWGEVEASRARMRVARGILQAGARMVDEELKFDEPKTEEGQQDGALRRAWLQAYEEGRASYTFNGDRYQVFDAQGRPRVPQVCIDFVFDAAERWSGAWWARSGLGPHKTTGFLDFGALLPNRRQIWRLVEFAQQNPDKMALLEIAGRTPYQRREAFYEGVRALSEEVLEGDVLVIFGLRDDQRNHWHSFFVSQTDPMGGAALTLMGNAGTAREQVWEDVMRSAPRRYLRHRVRLRYAWIEALRGVSP